MKGPLFTLGQLVATPAALDAMRERNINGRTLLARHCSGDWGQLCPEDAQANDSALTDGNRLLSAYKFSDIEIWIITEADRSVTTLLLPSDY